VRFSVAFGLGKTQAELDFVDANLLADTPLYLDPYALTTRDDDWSADCHSLVVSYFEAVLAAVQAGDQRLGTQLLSRLQEPSETRLGVSKGHSAGRGVGDVQAQAIFDAMARSAAARTGVLQDMSDFALFIPGLGRDKISDMTTNVIRKPLIDYTIAQCELLGVPMRPVPSGFYWDAGRSEWRQEYTQLPVYNGHKIILVPKYAVRWEVGVDHSQYRRHFVLEFLQAEHLRADDGLVTTFRNATGVVTRRVVFKKTVDEHYPNDKDFLATFSAAHPDVIEQYREALRLASSKVPELTDRFTERDLAEHLAEQLKRIPPGRDDADRYHTAMIGILSFLFFPNLIYPKKEAQINEGRKRIDITYTNGKENGLFLRLSLDPAIGANVVHAEMKNYTNEIANEEFDQLLGRFSRERGHLGLLLYRRAENEGRVLQRARDAARQGRGTVLPLNDEFVLDALAQVAAGNRHAIDGRLDAVWRQVVA
jgi:hypothetical protein